MPPAPRQSSLSTPPNIRKQESVSTDDPEEHNSAETPVVTSLVFLEQQQGRPSLLSSDRSSMQETSSGRSSSTSKLRYKSLAVLQTAGYGVIPMPPERLDKANVEALRDRLAAGGVDLTSWGVDGAKGVDHLFWEAYHQKRCVIAGRGHGRLKRVTRLVKIRLLAEIFGQDHLLLSRMQFMHDGQTVERLQVPLRKLVWLTSAAEDANAPFNDELVYAEQCPYTEDWRVGVRQALKERLGLPEKWQQAHLAEVPGGYTFHTEDNCPSAGYPGLNTLYCIHTVTLRVVDPEHVSVQCLGLPVGQEFATQEGDFNFSGGSEEEGLPIGTQLNIWTWCRADAALLTNGRARADTGACTDRRQQQVTSAASSSTSPPPTPAAACSSQAGVAPVRSCAARLAPEAGGVAANQAGSIRRVPLQDASAQTLVNMRGRMTRAVPRPPCSRLCAALEGERTDWARAIQIARRITDPSYCLKQYFEDLSTFPELNLYLLDASDGITHTASSSGRSIGDEYQRTVGAFFAIYWLFRLGIDGRDGFSFGVDENWKPVSQSAVLDEAANTGDPVAKKRLAFRDDANWDYFQGLLVDAGLVREDTKGCRARASGAARTFKVCEKRFLSLLSLTAVHDIMKMSSLIPEVQEQHAPYHGYAEWDQIGDHDHALSYIMDHFPDILPSFRDLEHEERRALQFTQCKFCFNHGWFVQGEAPPGAIFTSFREALVRDHKSQIGREDVALYFVHWLTDLAGAEPTPLAGCEKFSVKFPLPVLNSFLRSFAFVEKIADHTETEINEEYLRMRWAERGPDCGSRLGQQPLAGPDAIARMRILCMAQSAAPATLERWAFIPEEDREVLSTEMARTGCLGQSYSPELVPAEVREQPMGPAFLVYYGPAFLQHLRDGDCPARRLRLLAEVYRCARELWPAQVTKVAVNVTVRIDMIKALACSEIVNATQDGETWIMVKHNEVEAFIELASRRKLNKMISSMQRIQIVDMSCLAAL